jgi:hypothetical protein
MGRYAFFSTGLEYKFGFATQESSDIRMFGGVITTSKQDLQLGKYSHEWDYEKDFKYIIAKLRDIIDGTEINLPDFTGYEPCLEGTFALRQHLDSNSRLYWEWLGRDSYLFELGCLIYHQLTYEHKLNVGYEP